MLNKLEYSWCSYSVHSISLKEFKLMVVCTRLHFCRGSVNENCKSTLAHHHQSMFVFFTHLLFISASENDGQLNVSSGATVVKTKFVVFKLKQWITLILYLLLFCRGGMKVSFSWLHCFPLLLHTSADPSGVCFSLLWHTKLVIFVYFFRELHMNLKQHSLVSQKTSRLD